MIPRGLVAFAAAAATSLAVAVAPAGPTIWPAPKKTQTKSAAQADDEVHRTAATYLERARLLASRTPSAGGLPTDPEVRSLLEAARQLLEAHGARTSADVRLRFDLGLVLERLVRWADAAAVLEGAVALAPKHPLAESGWFALGVCYAHLGKHADEERAYLGALPVTERRVLRSIVYSNLAESRMQQGKLPEAIEAIETSIALEPDNPGAHWNRAILRDRDGDAWGALESARQALTMYPLLDFIDGDGVFFEPEYERNWYLALASLAHVEIAVTPDERKTSLMAALTFYRAWLDAAPADHRYRPRALDDVAAIEKRMGLKK